ncbi:D-alanine--D-alanine ligase [Candidatus Azambacteria bacterium]|nr:D-alanine--D-alanine ligase [Candidatus Azambacteria bacterium]
MKKRRPRVGIIFGGRSAEHEISLRSAKNVVEALDRKKYDPVLIGINKKGSWFLIDESRFFDSRFKIQESRIGGKAPDTSLLLLADVIFPILHGPFGEDGTLQGLLKLVNVPFVGASVLGSAVGMDKDVMKRLLREAGIPIGKFLTIKENGIPTYEKVVAELGRPFFVKPANMGSSVGVSKVKEKKDYPKAIQEAFNYDRKIILEENIIGREIECAILGNDNPLASIPGEVIPSHDFYSYEAKYLDENGARLEIPAKLSGRLVKKVQALAIKTFKALNCEGFGRVDSFLKENGEILVNEINTIPGFTSISMYPKMWEASGLGYTELLDRLIKLAFERFEKEKKLKTMR